MSVKILDGSEGLVTGWVYGAIVYGRASCQTPAFVAELADTGITPRTSIERWGSGVGLAGQGIGVAFAFEVSRSMTANVAATAIREAARRAFAQPVSVVIRTDTEQVRRDGGVAGFVSGLFSGSSGDADEGPGVLETLNNLSALPGELYRLGLVAIAAYLVYTFWGPK